MLYLDEFEINFDQIMVVLVEDVLNALEIMKHLNPDGGPICSIWVEGIYLTDNIEDKLRFGD